MTPPMDARGHYQWLHWWTPQRKETNNPTDGREGAQSNCSINDFTDGRQSGRETKQSEAKQQHESSSGIETYISNFKAGNSSIMPIWSWASIENKFKVGGQPDSALEERNLGAQDKFWKQKSTLNLNFNLHVDLGGPTESVEIPKSDD
jgi:hypothetical protein